MPISSTRPNDITPDRLKMLTDINFDFKATYCDPSIHPQLYAHQKHMEKKLQNKLRTDLATLRQYDRASMNEADRFLTKTVLAEGATLGGGLRKVQKGKRGYNANVLGLTQREADLACSRLQALSSCWQQPC